MAYVTYSLLVPLGARIPLALRNASLYD